MATDGEAGRTKNGYGKTRLLLFVGIALIGFTRLEDRAIISMPGAAPSAMAAMAIPPSDEVDDGSYADQPDGVVRVRNATRVPRNRIRRALRERDLGTVAARGVPTAAPAAIVAGEPVDAPAAEAVAGVLSPVPSGPVTFAALGPALGPTTSPVFSATPPAASSGGASSGGSTGGDGGNGGEVTPPVSAVPEPSTWISLILGLFAIGAVFRRKNRRVTALRVTAR